MASGSPYNLHTQTPNRHGITITYVLHVGRLPILYVEKLPGKAEWNFIILARTQVVFIPKCTPTHASTD